MATKKDSAKEIIQADDETKAEIEEVVETSDVMDEAASEKFEDEAAETTEKPKRVTKAGPKSAKALAEAEAESERKDRAESAKAEAPKPKPTSKPNPLKRHGKNYRKASEMIDKTKRYELKEAIELAKKTSTVKFDASMELHLNLGVDPRQADQMVRASVVLPAGSGKTIRIAVIAPDNKQADAKKAGADSIGGDDLVAKIEKGFLEFDKLVATPDFMPKLGKLAKVLGPKGLMPNPKSGTVTNDVAKAVEEAKAGKVEFRIDKQAIIHQAFGKVSFKDEELFANVTAVIDAVMKAKPGSTKGTYVKGMSLTTTMGPSIKLDVTAAQAASNTR